jgi:LysR family hydrogen peroxide-inducible transcriptional activator
VIPTLRQLEYVITVADEAHFGRAAKRCGVSQPALSKQVQEVESLLGVALFERARRGVTVTTVGAQVIARARRALEEVRGLTQAAQGVRDALVGRVALGVIPTVAPYFLPGLVGRLREVAPLARWEVHEQQTAHLIEALLSSHIDLALLALPLPSARAEDGLTGIDLFDEAFALVLPSGHPLARSAKPVRASALSGEALLLMEEGHCFRDQALSVCATARATEVDVRAASLTTLLAMVEAGLGPTLAPMMALDPRTCDALLASGVRVRAFLPPCPRRRIGLRWRASSPRGAHFEALASAFKMHAQSLSDRLPATLRVSALALNTDLT